MREGGRNTENAIRPACLSLKRRNGIYNSIKSLCVLSLPLIPKIRLRSKRNKWRDDENIRRAKGKYTSKNFTMALFQAVDESMDWISNDDRRISCLRYLRSTDNGKYRSPTGSRPTKTRMVAFVASLEKWCRSGCSAA